MWVGTKWTELVFALFGILFVDLSAPRLLSYLSPLPGNSLLQIPAGTPSAITLVLQGLGIDLTSSTGNLSGPVVLKIE